MDLLIAPSTPDVQFSVGNFNSFLHPNEPPESILLCIVRQLEADLSKIYYFQFSNIFFIQKST